MTTVTNDQFQQFRTSAVYEAVLRAQSKDAVDLSMTIPRGQDAFTAVWRIKAIPKKLEIGLLVRR